MVDKFKLRLFFNDLINLMYRHPGTPGFGSPVSGLVEQMCVHQEKFLGRICGDYTGDSHEFRLNQAGLKLYWHIDRETHQFKCSIGGDQANEYPDYCVQARERIRWYGFNKRP